MPIIYGATGLATSSSASGTNNAIAQGAQNELLASEISGKFYTNNRNSLLFGASVAAQTIPVVTAALASVYTLYNPPGSGINMEIVSIDIGVVVAATVVNSYGWYFSTAPLSAAGTFGAAITIRAMNMAGGVGKGQAYSAYTHSGTPVLIDTVFSTNTTTAVNFGAIQKFYDGRLILSPGIAMSFAASTAASTASSISPTTIWAERPL